MAVRSGLSPLQLPIEFSLIPINNSTVVCSQEPYDDEIQRNC